MTPKTPVHMGNDISHKFKNKTAQSVEVLYSELSVILSQ